MVTLDPASYTVILRGNNNTTGVGLNEVYDLSQSAASSLTAVGTRAQVAVGDDVLISGIIISQGNSDILVRGLGPTLASAGIPSVLADPTLELHGPAGFQTIINNNWRDTQIAEIIATGIPPTNDLESAIVANLAPGQYTGVLLGVGGGTGIAYIQFYTLPHSGPVLPLTP